MVYIDPINPYELQLLSMRFDSEAEYNRRNEIAYDAQFEQDEKVANITRNIIASSMRPSGSLDEAIVPT
jgi:hypothetical protein